MKPSLSSAPPCGFGGTADLGSSNLAWGAHGAAVTAQDGAAAAPHPCAPATFIRQGL